MNNKLYSLNYYYKHKFYLDNKRKQLYQKQKYKISQEKRVLKICKLIIKYELLK